MGAPRAPGRPPGAADVGPHPVDPPAALLQGDSRRPRVARAPRIVVVIIAGGYPMPAAAAVLALERDHVAAIAAHASSGGEGEAYLAVGRGRDAVGQAALQRERQDE